MKFTTTPPPFVPSSWRLEQQLARAMAACDADIEQARLRKEARASAARNQVAAHVEHRRPRPGRGRRGDRWPDVLKTAGLHLWQVP